MEEISQKEGAAVRLPYDVIVVGPGAAGMMAAGTAARNGHRVLPVSYTHLDVYKRQFLFSSW